MQCTPLKRIGTIKIQLQQIDLTFREKQMTNLTYAESVRLQHFAVVHLSKDSVLSKYNFIKMTKEKTFRYHPFKFVLGVYNIFFSGFILHSQPKNHQRRQKSLFFIDICQEEIRELLRSGSHPSEPRKKNKGCHECKRLFNIR